MVPLQDERSWGLPMLQFQMLRTHPDRSFPSLLVRAFVFVSDFGFGISDLGHGRAKPLNVSL